MEIRAKDIVGISGGEVSFATAGKWLKSPNPSVAVKYALMYFRLKLPSAENFSDGKAKSPIGKAPKKTATQPKTGSKKIPATQPAKIHTTQPAIRSVTLQPFAINTMDKPMTRRLKMAAGSRYWILYCTNHKYRLGVADENASLVLEEGKFKLEDFEIV